MFRWSQSAFTLVALCVWLCGCAQAPPTTAALRDDQFRPFREVETPPYRFAVRPGAMILRLAGHIDRQTGETRTMVKVHHNYLGQHRHNYESARNSKAEALKFNVVARYGNCRVRTDCPLDELYIVDVPEAELRAAKAGYPYKVFPRVGPDILVTVPQETIVAFLTLLDKERANPSRTVASAGAATEPAKTKVP